MKPTIEQQVAQTLLQQATEVKIGDKTYTAAPPSVATLILVSEAVSRLPQRILDKANIVSECLAVAKDCRFLGDVAAILLLGARHINSQAATPQTAPQNPVRRFFSRLFHRQTAQTAEQPLTDRQRLANDLLEEMSPAKLHGLIATLLQGMELADFFALTTFLTEVNLTRQTKVGTSVTTAFGQ